MKYSFFWCKKTFLYMCLSKSPSNTKVRSDTYKFISNISFLNIKGGIRYPIMVIVQKTKNQDTLY